MMSVSYWELRLCGRCIRSWGAFIRRLQLVGGMVQTVHRRRVWRQLRLAFEEKVARSGRHWDMHARVAVTRRVVLTRAGVTDALVAGFGISGSGEA